MTLPRNSVRFSCISDLRHRRRMAAVLLFRNLRHEPVAVTLDGCDVFAFFSGAPESFSESRNVSREIAVFHKLRLPNLFDQFVFLQKASGIFGKNEQEIENASGQWYLFTVTQTYPVCRIDLEFVKNVPALVGGSPVFAVVC